MVTVSDLLSRAAVNANNNSPATWPNFHIWLKAYIENDGKIGSCVLFS